MSPWPLGVAALAFAGDRTTSFSGLTASPSPIRGQQLWRSSSAGGVATLVKESGVRAQPLPLDLWAAEVSAKHHPPSLNASNDSFFDFLPAFEGSSVPAGANPRFSTPCFEEVTVSSALEGQRVTVTFAAKGRKRLVCSDLYVLTTQASVHLEIVRTLSPSATHTVTWTGLAPLEVDDVRAAGVRVFRTEESMLGTVVSAYETALLFLEPQLLPAVTEAAARRNIAFLRTKAPGSLAPHAFEERATTDVLPDEAEIADGDLLCILRLDGLDPLINWGTGGGCGHNVMALRINGTLHIVESQSKSGYWPIDNIQRNAWPEWVKMAKRASYNVLHIRLSAASRARFNASAALAAFEGEFEGVPYGLPNMLWGWFDGPSDNFPEPLDADRPVHLVATLFSVMDPLVRNVTGGTDSLWNGAIAHRLQLPVAPDQETAQLLAIARARNVSFGQLLRMPEQDEWAYPLTEGTCRRLGRAAGCAAPAQVCNVFVCKMWRAGGLLDGGFNCGEQTPLDTYGMRLFDTAPALSAACRAADPMNTAYCQILGKYRMQLPHLSSVAPHANMSESCPSKAPNYEKRFDPTVAARC